MNRSKRANHFGTICEKRMARKRRFSLERASWHDARLLSRPIRCLAMKAVDTAPHEYMANYLYDDGLGPWFGAARLCDATDPHHMLLIHYVHLAENKTWKPEAQCLGNSPASDRGKFCVAAP